MNTSTVHTKIHYKWRAKRTKVAEATEAGLMEETVERMDRASAPESGWGARSGAAAIVEEAGMMGSVSDPSSGPLSRSSGSLVTSAGWPPCSTSDII